MLTLPHAIVGATLFILIPNKILAFILALLSHFILDFTIPHWNPSLYEEYHNHQSIGNKNKIFVWLDAMTALSSVLLIIGWQFDRNLWQGIGILLASGLAILPDAIKIPYFFFHSRSKILQRYIRWENKYQKEAKTSWGIAIQLAVIFCCVCLLFFRTY